MKDRYESAPTFRDYLESVEKNRELWHGIWRRVRLPPDLVQEAREDDRRWRLLALSEDWCGDAVNLLPVVARFAEAVDWDFRVLSRDENPDLMDAHLTGGRSRSIPVVMLLDEDYEERGWWGPRPEELQSWVVSEGLSTPSAERYRKVRRWYATDRGRTTLREILGRMREASAVT